MRLLSLWISIAVISCGLCRAQTPFNVSQNFETTGTGLSFTTNVVNDDLGPLATTDTFNFTDSLFAGDGFNDYVAVLPLMSSLASSTNYNGSAWVFTNLEGSNYILIEDTQGNEENLPNAAEDELILTFEPLDISGLGSTTVTLAAAAPRGAGYPNGTHIVVEAIIDGTSTITLGQFRGTNISGDGSLALDTDLDDVGDGTVLGTAFQDFAFGAVIQGGNSMVVRVRMRSLNASDEIAIDNIRIQAIVEVPVELSELLIE